LDQFKAPSRKTINKVTVTLATLAV
jgi:hypothetical protein